MSIQPSVFYAEPFQQFEYGTGILFGVFSHRGMPPGERLLKLEIGKSQVSLHFSDQRVATIFKNTIQFWACPIEKEYVNSDSRKYVMDLSLSYSSYLSVERLLKHIQESNTFEDARSGTVFTRTVEAFQTFNRANFLNPQARPKSCCEVL